MVQQSAIKHSMRIDYQPIIYIKARVEHRTVHVPEVWMLARRSQPGPGHLADELPVHGIIDTVLRGRFRVVAEHDFNQAVRFRDLLKQPAAFLTHFAATINFGNQTILHFPTHRFGQFAWDTLDASQIDFAVGLPIAIKHAASSPGKVAATGGIAGAELHAVKTFAVVACRQFRAERILHINYFSGGDHFAHFFGQFPQYFAGEFGVVASEKSCVAFEVNMVGFHALFVELGAAFFPFAAHSAMCRSERDEYRPDPDHNVRSVHRL